MTTDLTANRDTVLLLLRRIHFFDGLKFEDLERLSSHISLASIEPGEIILRTGEEPEAFYIIEHGRVEIFRETSQGEEVIATLGRSGDFFGEMALLENRTRSSSVRALTPTELLVISRTDFNDLIREYPTIHLEVTKALSFNLRRSDSHFVEKLLEKNNQLTQALKDLEEAQGQLLQKERLSLVGRLAAGIIHDLKKPLTCISGYAQLIGGDSVELEKRKRYSANINREVQRMVDMTGEILQFAKGDLEINRRKVRTEEWVRESAGGLLDEFKTAKVHFIRKIEYGGALFIDPEKFKSVFNNIASNALAAMPQGGTFTFSCHREGPHVRMDFCDTGLGMSADVCARVFEEFFSPWRDGTGLGMAIVKRIVESHGGTITVESEPGKGAKYTILLPLEVK
jgi:signal transduction histidine kinase